MTFADGILDLYRLLEREVRTPKRRLLLDAFLPPAEAIPTAFPSPPPPAPPAEPQAGAARPGDEFADAFGLTGGASLEEEGAALERARGRTEPDAEPDPDPEHDREPEPARKGRPARSRKAAAPPAKKERPKTLQEEIEEFMNRDQRGLSPDDDFTAFTTTSLDPNSDPAATPGPEPPPAPKPAKSTDSETEPENE